MSKKKSHKKSAFVAIILFAIVILVAYISFNQPKVSPEDQKVYQDIKEANSKLGPLEIKEEYLGPNQNAPITPYRNE